jgi:hypothetical protein
MGLINRAMMKTVVHHALNHGKAGIEQHRDDVIYVLSELTDEQLALHLYALEQSLELTHNELERRQ